MKISKTQKVPKWFKSEIYEDGAWITNPINGSSYKLNNVELSIYDFIKGSELVFKSIGYDKINAQQIRDFEKALYWFRANNPRAYKVLLD
jgi:hypothetical protein